MSKHQKAAGSGGGILKKLFPYTKKFRLYAILCPATVTIEVLLEICIPVLMSKIVDVGITGKDITYVLKVGALMVLASLASLTFGALSGKFAAMAGMGFGSEVRGALFGKVQEFSFSNIAAFSSASLVTRLTTDVTNVQNAFMMMVRVLVRAPVMLVGATFMAFSINHSLVTVFLIAIPVLGAALAVVACMAYSRFRAMLKTYDSMNGSVQENLIAIRVVKAFVRAPQEKQKFKKAVYALRDASIRAEHVIAFNTPVMQLVMYSCIVAILWFGGNQIVAGQMQTGELISFISYVTQILMSLMMISMVFVNMVLSRASADRILEVLEEPVDIADAGGESIKSTPVREGSVEFCDVSFRYAAQSGENVLSQINLKINPGETIGILGGTGSAKTTLVQLIPRLYDVTQGKVLVGGRDVRDYSLKELRSAVGMVLQKNVLFSGTIRDNLKWGNPNASEEEIQAACRAAQADEFVRSFPNEYDTDLGQGGVNVSGGQKQRLCIARALLKRPKILILDDSTSAVDTATDAKIRRAFRETLKDTTTLIIAQRIASVCEADRIVVLDNGRIDAVGTHDELLAANRIYQEVYSSQQKGVA